MTTQLTEYLDYYVSLDRPGYAVLVTGAWGAGKTYQVKEVIGKDLRWYVSLFGKSSVQEVNAAVLAAMDPTLTKMKEVVDGAGGAARDLGFGIGGVISDVIGTVFRQKIDPDGGVLVFDDLERSDIETKDLLGVINEYLEHHGCRVIVIAHDEKLADEFAGMKEKMFGQTIAVQPQTQAAADHFIDQIGKAEAKAFVTNFKREILAVFRDSGEHSLRILRHVIMDVGRLYEAIAPEHRDHQQAMTEVAKLFSALNIETRSGRLPAGALRNRANATMAHQMRRRFGGDEDAVVPAIVTANERYMSVDLEDQLLTDETLTECLVHGRYDAGLIIEALAGSRFFSDRRQLRPWQVVINFDQLSDEEVEAGINQLEQEFADRAVTDSGEMLHIFTLRMMLAENGARPGTIEQRADEAIEYIDDLLEAGRLPPRGSDWQWTREFERSHGRMGYWVSQVAAPHFQRIWDHLISSRAEAHKRGFSARADDVLNQVTMDGDQFICDFSQADDTMGIYATTPVLMLIPAEGFVDAWLGGHPSNWDKINIAMERRYHHGNLAGELAEESPWVVDMMAELEARAEAEQGLAALRIRRVIPKVFREHVAYVADNAEDEDFDTE